VSAVREIVVPETEPATEWILGQAVQKVSPQAQGRGEAAPEWHLGAGVTLLLIVDPKQRSVDAYESGTHRALPGPSTFTSHVFPDLTISFADAFAKLDLPA
jgi:hypothetical protein